MNAEIAKLEQRIVDLVALVESIGRQTNLTLININQVHKRLHQIEVVLGSVVNTDKEPLSNTPQRRPSNSDGKANRFYSPIDDSLTDDGND